jgi:hypothetical protein
MVSLVIGKDTGIITEDEHRVLQLASYICVNKYIILTPIKGAMGRGRAGLETGTSSVQGVTIAIITCLATGGG